MQGRRKGTFAKHKSNHRNMKTKHYKRDIDQIHHDLKPENQIKLLNQPIDEDLPGFGQFYCINCARYFTTDAALQTHFKSKVHKKVKRKLKEVPYSHEEAEQCGK